MKKNESLKSKKFKELSSEKMEKVSGGFKVIYADQQMASTTGSSVGVTGDYGYHSFLGVAWGKGFFRADDTYSEVA
jgi:bacteriocin-like protein